MDKKIATVRVEIDVTVTFLATMVDGKLVREPVDVDLAREEASLRLKDLGIPPGIAENPLFAYDADGQNATVHYNLCEYQGEFPEEK